MNSTEIDVGETHIRLTTDLGGADLRYYIHSIRRDLKNYIAINQDFLLSLEPIDIDVEEAPLIVRRMQDSSIKSQVGPMACVAGTISELSLEYLVENGSKHSIVENGGDIALVNDRKVLCGIYSNNRVLGNNIAFELKPRRKAVGICSSSGKIGHSISFGDADSVTVISNSASLSDGLATRIANDVSGLTGEDKVFNALDTAECFKEFFEGVLIISSDNVGTVGKLPRIVESPNFDFKI